MKPAKITAFLFPKPYSNGEHPIFIRITQNRKSSYVSTGYSIPAGAWDDGHGMVWTSMPTLTKKKKETYSPEKIKELKDLKATVVLVPNADKINSVISTKLGELEKLQNKLSANQENYNAETLKKKYENRDLIDNSKKDFLLYIEEITKRKFEGKQIRTSEKYSAMLRKLKKFHNDKPLPIEDLTTSLLNDFQLSLKKGGAHQNYIHGMLKALRTIIQKEAIKEDKILSPDKNPFIWFTMPKVLPSMKEKLDLIEIKNMEDAVFPTDDPRYHVRNAFIFSLYNAGIRIGDLLQLRWCNIKPNGRLEYSMGKTSSNRSIKLLPQALNILKLYKPAKEKETDFIFPFLDNNVEYSKLITPEDHQKASSELLSHLFNKIESQIALYNKTLKLVALKSKIKKNLSSHIARHSFADIARKKVSVYDIQKMLGHSNIKITEVYLKSLDNDAMDKAMNEVFK